MSAMPVIAAALAAVASACASADAACFFDCTGHVAFVCGGEPQRLIMLQDGEPQEVSLSRSFWLKDADRHRVKSGDVIHISGIVTEPTGGRFIREHNLPSASVVQSALRGLTEKEIVYRTPRGYIVYDRFMSIWLKRTFG